MRTQLKAISAAAPLFDSASTAGRRTRAAAAASLALMLSACGGGPEGPLGDDFTQVSDELFVKRTAIWPSLNIPVCWENPSQNDDLQRGWVEEAVSATWEYASKVRFTGWGTCSPSSGGLRIRISDEIPHVEAHGRELDGLKNGVVLNLIFVQTLCFDFLQSCVEGSSVHEFGHALGLDHEHNRPDSDCSDQDDQVVGDTRVGPYDSHSVMNYCAQNQYLGLLSEQDKMNITHYYGDPQSASLKKDVVAWGDRAYFFFGNRYSRFNITADRMADLYPIPTSAGWGNWPAWSTGVDAAVDYSTQKLYFFRGSQYLRYDKTADTVDAGYPKSLPGGWKNWPSTWTSVDAAVKWPNGKIYMFRGSQYLRISSGTTVDSGYPKPITGNWSIPYTTGFDYVVPWNNGKAYFFKGENYIRYNIATSLTDAGYPKKIMANWPGVAF